MIEWDESPERDRGEPDYCPVRCDCGHDELEENIVVIGGKTYCLSCYENAREAAR